MLRVRQRPQVAISPVVSRAADPRVDRSSGSRACHPPPWRSRDRHRVARTGGPPSPYAQPAEHEHEQESHLVTMTQRTQPGAGKDQRRRVNARPPRPSSASAPSTNIDFVGGFAKPPPPPPLGGWRRSPGVLLEADLPEVALDHGAERELAARRERDLARGDRSAGSCRRADRPTRCAAGSRSDRAGPGVADRVARLEVVLARWRGAVLETFLLHMLATAGDRLGLPEPQVVLHVGLAVARVEAGQHEVAAAISPPTMSPPSVIRSGFVMSASVHGSQ